MRTILFVDDEPNVLEALQRMLYPLKKEWHMAFVPNAAKALELMAQTPYEVVVTDMRMPGMDGAELLSEVMRLYPDTIRFVLSGQSDKETIFRSVGAAHQFLAKPCNPKILKSTVDRAFALRRLLNNQSVKEAVAMVGSLPALPETYTRLMDELRSPDASIIEVGKIIESDLGMTAKILQLVNSAFFGVRRQVSTAAQAVSLLGLDTIKALVLMNGIFQTKEVCKLPEHFSIDHLWRHSMTVGAYAQSLGKAEAMDEGVKNECLTAGLLHDAGVLLLAVGCPEQYETVLTVSAEKALPLTEVERIIFGCSHGEVGAYLLGIWGLPDPIVEAVAFHHHPSDCPTVGFGALAAVHAAEVFAYSNDEEDRSLPQPTLDAAFIETLGLSERIAPWRDICHAISKRQSEAENE